MCNSSYAGQKQVFLPGIHQVKPKSTQIEQIYTECCRQTLEGNILFHNNETSWPATLTKLLDYIPTKQVIVFDPTLDD